jgi:hypothetical protein
MFPSVIMQNLRCHEYMKKEFGGLGIPNIRELNLCLLDSWLRRYSLDDNKIWK